MNNIKLMVCPHDTAGNPDKWYHFAQYLTQNLSNSVHFEQSIDFPDFHQHLISGELIYANPQDSIRLVKEHGFIPIARPSNLFDEIVFVASTSIENPQITDITSNTVITVNSMLVSKVGLKYLLDRDIKPSSLKSAESWMAVVKAIFRNEEKFGFLYKDFYAGLNSLTKGSLQRITETHDGTIHHNLLVSPKLADLSEQIQQCLTEMHLLGDRSEVILQQLGIKQFLSVSKDDINKFEALTMLGNDLTKTKEEATEAI